MLRSTLAELAPERTETARETETSAQENATHPRGDANAHLYSVVDNTKDYFVEKDGVRFAGTHILVELWGGSRLDDPELIDRTLRQGAVDAGASILHSHMHHFTPNGGVSGVVVLAESHISIHTWPERDYAAIDVFMCGACNPHDALDAIKRTFSPEKLEVTEYRRGIIT